jgi:hypothetical protein
MERRVGVVNQEATTLTSLENESVRCPSSENLVRDNENGTQQEGLQVPVKLKHSGEGSRSLSLYEPVQLASRPWVDGFLRSSNFLMS